MSSSSRRIFKSAERSFKLQNNVSEYMFHHAAGSVSNNFNNNHGSSNSGGGGYGENWSPNIDKAAREFFNHKSNNSNKDNGDE